MLNFLYCTIMFLRKWSLFASTVTYKEKINKFNANIYIQYIYIGGGEDGKTWLNEEKNFFKLLVLVESPFS